MLDKAQIKGLIREFEENYLNEERGKNHLRLYEKEMKEVKRNFAEIKKKSERGENITDDVLYRLLPYVDNKTTKEKRYRRSAWGFIIKDVKTWFEEAGWQSSEDWPEVATAIFKMIDGLVSDRDPKHIEEFIRSGHGKGFQAGLISPILYCLDEYFLVINNKTVDTVRYLAKEKLIDRELSNYLENINKLTSFIENLETPLFDNYNVFDMFCHWMCDKRLGGYARVPKASGEISEEEAIRIANFSDDPKDLEMVFLKYIHKPSIVRRIVDNLHCPNHVKRDYIDYVLTKHLPAFRKSLIGTIHDWEDLLIAVKVCLEVWNPPREIAPIIEIDVEEPEIYEIFQSLSNYKQVILYGPPGTSKTYFAKGLAKALVGGEERFKSNVLFVQFHPSYSYEDFVEGLFPKTDTKGNVIFEIRDQIFKNMCRKAEEDPKENIVIILDEINRADLSKVFGEIFSALEYRKDVVKLLYSRADFTIPSNLHIIGTMNTLDKSTVDIDFAFMRRFKFFEILPSAEILRRILKDNGVEDELVEKTTSTFEQIQGVFPLGHAYFKDVKTKLDLKLLWEHQLSFLLKEFFGDIRKADYDKAKEVYFGGLEIDTD